MVDKHIADLTEDTTPVETSDLVIQQPSGGATRKSKLVNLLKNVFGHKDVYNDYIINGTDIQASAGGNNPVWTNLRDNIWLWGFRGTSGVDHGFFTLHIQHDFKAGQSPTFHVHWTHNVASPTGNVKWQLEYTLAKGYETEIFGPSVTMSTIQAAGTQYLHHVTADSDMVIPASSSLEPDTIIIGRIFRNADDVQDTFSGVALLTNIDMHYIASRVGTIEEDRPFTSGGF